MTKDRKMGVVNSARGDFIAACNLLIRKSTAEPWFLIILSQILILPVTAQKISQKKRESSVAFRNLIIKISFLR